MVSKVDNLLEKWKKEKKFFKKHPCYDNIEETITFDENGMLTIRAINVIHNPKFDWFKKLTPKVELFKVHTMLHFMNEKIYFHLTNMSRTYDYKAVIFIDKNTLELVFEKEVLDYDSKLLKTISKLINESVRANIRQQLREDFQIIVQSYDT